MLRNTRKDPLREKSEECGRVSSSVKSCFTVYDKGALRLCDDDGNTFSSIRDENNEVYPTMKKCEESHLRDCGTCYQM